MFASVLFIYSTKHTFLNFNMDHFKDKKADEELLMSVLVSFVLLASAMLQLGWCGYLAVNVGPRLDFSRIEFVIPESEFLEEEEEESQLKYD